MTYRVKALTKKGERYIGKNMQLTKASRAGEWPEEKAKNVAKARSKSSNISECRVMDGNRELIAVYKDGNCQKPVKASFDCTGNKQESSKMSREKQIHPVSEEPDEDRLDFKTFAKTFAPAAPSKKEFAASADQDRELLEQTMMTILDFLSLCDRAQNLLSTYSQKQAQEDALQEDLLHIIELTENVNAAQGYRLYKDLRDCRKRRRVDKDLTNLLGSLLELRGKDSAKNLRKTVQSMSDRKYRSRVDEDIIPF
jgi:hypothetical protein